MPFKECSPRVLSDVEEERKKNMSKPKEIYSAEQIKKICLDAGADGVGLVDVNSGGLQREREGILHVYSLTRVANNRENMQSPARYVANEEFHHTGDRASSVSRAILRGLNQLGIRGVVVNKDIKRQEPVVWLRIRSF